MKSSALITLALALTMTGCGLAPSSPISPTKSKLQSAAEKKNDTAQIDAIVKRVLDGQFKVLLTEADADHDGQLSEAEYGKHHDTELMWIFMALFDGNEDGRVSSTEYQAALKEPNTIEAYNHLTMDHMKAAVQPFIDQGGFGFNEMRSYVTKTLGLTGDFLYMSKLMAKVDLNQDGKAFSDNKESSAFTLLFAQAQLESVLGLPVSQIAL